MQISKKIPPFGKNLLKLIKDGLRPTNDVNLFCGLSAWGKSSEFAISWPERTLCLPPWSNPDQFYWPVLQCAVLIIDTMGSEQDYIDSIASAVFRDGASTVRFISENFNLINYIKESA